MLPARAVLFLIAVLTAAGPAQAEDSVAAAARRVRSQFQALFSKNDLAPAALRLSNVIPAIPPGAPIANQPAPNGPLFRPDLWERLQPPDPQRVAWLSKQINGFSPEMVRQLSIEDADALVAEAASRGYYPIDIFTDEGLLAPRVYYVPGDVLVKLFNRYDIRVLTPIAGFTTDGAPFEMQALVLGAGRVSMLYNLDNFQYEIPRYPGYTFVARRLVSQTIRGPGELAVAGLSIDMFLHPKVQYFVKIPPSSPAAPAKIRVETNRGHREKEIEPIRRLDAVRISAAPFPAFKTMAMP